VSSKRADFIARRQGKPNGQTLILLVIGAGLMLIAVAAFLSIPKAQAEVVSAGASAIPMAVNFPAPEVKLTDLQGNPVALSDYQGQVVLYNAWATWCPPCKEEMPTLEAFYQEYKDSGLVIVAIEDGEPASEVADFVKNYQLTFPVWPDPKWVATTAFKSDSLPTSFVIDRTGVVRLTWTGAISRAMLEKYVTPMLGQ
jgi:cytochrome c biogenesis protein CcmG, thiol:disulfide interchange protein DsbE